MHGGGLTAATQEGDQGPVLLGRLNRYGTLPGESYTPHSGGWESSTNIGFCHKLAKDFVKPLTGSSLPGREHKLRHYESQVLCHVVVPLGLLHMSKIQIWFGCLCLDPI